MNLFSNTIYSVVFGYLSTCDLTSLSNKNITRTMMFFHSGPSHPPAFLFFAWLWVAAWLNSWALFRQTWYRPSQRLSDILWTDKRVVSVLLPVLGTSLLFPFSQVQPYAAGFRSVCLPAWVKSSPELKNKSLAHVVYENQGVNYGLKTYRSHEIWPPL